MFALNVSCPTCKVAFNNSDTVHVTSCGHTFHLFCLDKWRLVSRICPVCKAYNPTVHNIYLNFENSPDYETTVNKLNAALETSNNEVAKMKREMAKKVNKIDEIKRLYNISEQWRAELEDKILKLSNEFQVKDSIHMMELNEKRIEIETLKTCIETAPNGERVEKSVEERGQNAITSELRAENYKLKEESEMSKLILNSKIEMLEEKLKHFKFEFQKQLAENISSPAGNLKEVEKENQEHVSKIAEEAKKIENKKKSHNVRAKNRANQRNQKLKLTQNNDCRVLIKDLAANNMILPLTNTVLILALQMSLVLTSDDITKVDILEPKGFIHTLGKVNLIVEFKTIEIKTKFLANKNCLKYNLNTKSIQIKEYVDETIYPIFMYANRKLRANGYEFICCRDNQVFAKKKITDTEQIKIQNKNDVDQLLGSLNVKTSVNPLTIFDL